MGLLKALIRAVVAIFVVVAGLLAAMAMALVAMLFFLFRRPRPSAGRVPGAQGRPMPKSAGDAIDVTATEVPADPTKPA